jgi:glyoxylase-like metal-dependent hydrolase (beta-lactamase superfamily II)
MKGSSIDGFIAAQALILSLSNEKTVIVPGHGPLARRSDIEKSLWRMREARRRIAALIEQGLSVDEVLERRPLEDLDPFFGDPANRRELTMSPAATRYIYAALKEKGGNGATAP